MVRIDVIASSSKGNAYVIVDGGRKIIIDPGLAFRQLQIKCGFTMSQFDFALVSHEHKDHSASARALARMGVPIVTSVGTAEAIGVLDTLPYLVTSGVEFELRGWRVMPFDVAHDAAEPMGFCVITPSGEKVLFAIDLHYMKYKFRDVNHYMIECNYQEKYLSGNKDLEESVKRRIRRSHMELDTLLEFFGAQGLRYTRSIYLLHLSDNHCDPDYCMRRVQEVTGVPTYLPPPNPLRDAIPSKTIISPDIPAVRTA